MSAWPACWAVSAMMCRKTRRADRRAPGASWSARRVLLHIVAETAQHAGHADIIREAIDGQKTMG